jgi:hypothetical protein
MSWEGGIPLSNKNETTTKYKQHIKQHNTTQHNTAKQKKERNKMKRIHSRLSNVRTCQNVRGSCVQLEAVLDEELT